MSEDDNEYEVEAILKDRIFRGKKQYFVKWAHYDETTWEFEKNLTNCKELIEQYEENSNDKRKNESPRISKSQITKNSKNKKKESELIDTKEIEEEETKKESFECLNCGLVKGKIAYRIKNTTSHEIFYVSTEEAKEKYLKQIIKFLESKIVIVSK